jgi:hypothetical protein
MLLAAVLSVARASIYPIDITFKEPTLELISEGPMYSRLDAPVGGDNSMISGVVDAIPMNEGGKHTVGVVVTSDPSLEKELPNEILECQNTRTSTYRSQFFDTPSSIIYAEEIKRTGPQYVFIMVCPKSSVSQSAVRILGTVAFRNPYGYLAASSFAFLPFYGVLLVVYVLTTGFYMFLSMTFKRNLTLLHYGTIAVFVFGVLEVVCMFLLYLQLNITGVPVCCPLRALAVLSIALNALKRSGSRILLLAVAVGYGVTKNRLTFKEKVIFAAIGASYFIAAAVKDFEMDTNAVPASMESWLMIPVTVLDIITITYFYMAISETRAGLEDTMQTIKLDMYRKLTVAIGCFIAIWAVMACFSVAVYKKILPLPWEHVWVLHCFWHVAYFGLLVTIALIWSPSKNSHQLAYSFQIAMDEEEADMVDDAVAFDESDDFDDLEGSQ